MPQVNGNAIKDRAARLRRAGEAAVSKHLEQQVGKTHNILMENPNMGRTEQFTEVRFDAPQREGSIIKATIVGVQDDVLVA